MDASLRLLRAFLVVAEEEHVGRAAQRLLISQPSLSQDVRRLERAAGVELFSRSRRGVELTPAGRIFADEVRQALDLIELGADQARRTAAAERPRVSLAYTPSLGNRLLRLLLPELERRCPDLEIEERELDTGEVGPAVVSGRFDLGLAHCPARAPGLRQVVLAEEPLVAALGSGHRLARRGEPVAIAELAGLDLLLWPRELAPDYHDHLLRICGQPSVRTGPRRALTRSYLFAEEGVFALLPAGASAQSVPGVTFLPLEDERATAPLVLLSRAEGILPEVARVQALLVEVVPGLLIARRDRW
ncbi:MAG: LysR substrate-binding domain-containing protein [Streptosporangiaceae bacterium]